jgi:cardiolipin synthase A/B
MDVYFEYFKQFSVYLNSNFSLTIFFITTHLIFAGLSSFHAMIVKRDPRAALGWMSICIIFPIVGPVLYVTLGINRVKAKAQLMAGRASSSGLFGYERGNIVVVDQQAPQSLAAEYWRYARVASVVEQRILSSDNSVSILENGDQAYPEMLKAIHQACDHIYLCSYIFDSDEIGCLFVKALSDARERGVEVRVLVDGIGEFYSRPKISRLLKQSNIIVEQFNPPSLIPVSININLRNHRKILVVDSMTGFTGGMNISDCNITAKEQRHKSNDLHFKLEGPVVEQLASVFADDWLFVTNSKLALTKPLEKQQGESFCRCITDGPGEDMDKLAFILNSLISTAERTVTIITPYFLPNREMISNIQSAAIRGVDVKIILPRKSNIRIIDWATQNMLWELLQCRVNIFFQPEPFAHTKLILIDELYAQVGSANLDPRSLRLNFELNLEIFDKTTTRKLASYSNEIIKKSRKIDLSECDERPLLVRARDAFFWLFMHYL